MTCPHAETTTLLWIAGEADPHTDERHGLHVAACDDCRAVLALHADVAAAVGPVAPALARTVPPLPEPANRRVPWLVVAALAAAAVALAVLLPSVSVVEPATAPDAAVVATGGPEADVDAALEAVDLEIADLSIDFDRL